MENDDPNPVPVVDKVPSLNMYNSYQDTTSVEKNPMRAGPYDVVEVTHVNILTNTSCDSSRKHRLFHLILNLLYHRKNYKEHCNI